MMSPVLSVPSIVLRCVHANDVAGSVIESLPTRAVTALFATAMTTARYSLSGTDATFDQLGSLYAFGSIPSVTRFRAGLRKPRLRSHRRTHRWKAVYARS